MAQRLARVVCPKCREPVDLPASVLLDLGVPEAEARPITAYHGTGCSNCGGTGFRGRTALYEVMAMTDSLRESVLSGASSAELKRQARTRECERCARVEWRRSSRDRRPSRK